MHWPPKNEKDACIHTFPPLYPDPRPSLRYFSLRIPYNAALLNDRQRTLVYYVQGP